MVRQVGAVRTHQELPKNDKGASRAVPGSVNIHSSRILVPLKDTLAMLQILACARCKLQRVLQQRAFLHQVSLYTDMTAVREREPHAAILHVRS